MKHWVVGFLAIGYLLMAQPTIAEKPALAEKSAHLTALNWLDRNHLQQQQQRIDELARLKLGTQLHHNRDDLELLQRIINRGLIDRGDRLHLQALGAVLGDIMAEEFGLIWQVYEDEIGRSRAICVPETGHCLFPITMLSRRMEVGLLPNVMEIYNNAYGEIKPYLPTNPYEATTD